MEKKKDLAYAVAFQLSSGDRFLIGETEYEFVQVVYDRRYDNYGNNTLAVVYNYKLRKYQVLVVSDEKTGRKKVSILNRD